MRRTELQRKLDVHALTDAGAQRARQSANVPLPQCEADGSLAPMQCTLNNAAWLWLVRGRVKCDGVKRREVRSCARRLHRTQREQFVELRGRRVLLRERHAAVPRVGP